MNAPSFSHSYMATNRAYPSEQWSSYIYPAEPGTSFYFQAKGAYNADPNAYVQVNEAPTSSMPRSFRESLEADLAVAAQNGCPQITLYIHGLGNYFSDACAELGTFGANLRAQGYKGLVIGFSWPSYGLFESWNAYGSLPYRFPPEGTYGTIRDNINGSTASLLELLGALSAIAAERGAALNVFCHSEGNYLLMLALHALSQRPATTVRLGQVLSLAADIDTGAFQTLAFAPPSSGQGAWIAGAATAVTVYWSSQDDVLPVSEGWTDYHNPSYSGRLGLRGPDSFADGALLPNVYGLDCSAVVNPMVLRNTPHVPPFTTTHSAYFYIPQVLADMARTLDGVPPGQVANRRSAGAPDGRAYAMVLAADTATGRFKPRGRRLAKEVPPPGRDGEHVPRGKPHHAR